MDKNVKKGVTIITATMRPQFIDEVFKNYARQKWGRKELIIVLSKGDMNMAEYEERAKAYPNVKVFQLAERNSLGECLNYGVSQAKYHYIAKFDDDDYYGPHYIAEAMYMFRRSKADLVGKQSYFFFFPHRKLLLLRRTNNRPFRRCRRIAGATIMFRKRVSKRVKFVKVPRGTDVRFVGACLRKGYKMYSTSKYNFAAFRRADRQSHTWKVSEKRLMRERNNRRIKTSNFVKHVDRPLGRIKKS